MYVTHVLYNTKHYMYTKKHIVDMRESTVELNYIVNAEVQCKKKRKRKKALFSIA